MYYSKRYLKVPAASPPAVEKYKRQVEFDLLSTMPNDAHFNDNAAEGARIL